MIDLAKKMLSVIVICLIGTFVASLAYPGMESVFFSIMWIFSSIGGFLHFRKSDENFIGRIIFLIFGILFVLIIANILL